MEWIEVAKTDNSGISCLQLFASAFALDPEIKWECIWAGNTFRPASWLVDREGGVIKVGAEREWEVVARHAASFDSLFGLIADPVRTPEVATLREIDDVQALDEATGDAFSGTDLAINQGEDG